jgi:hypothetical protein
LWVKFKKGCIRENEDHHDEMPILTSLAAERGRGGAGEQKQNMYRHMISRCFI